MDRLEAIVAALPEAERVDVAEWGDHPTFRVRGKNFVFAADASSISVKLPKEEAGAVVATDECATPAGYGLGRHGWVSLTLAPGLTDERWEQIAEWVETSYRLIAPRRLVKQLDEA